MSDQLFTNFTPGLLYSWIDNGAVICMDNGPIAIKFGYLQINFRETIERNNLPIDLKLNRHSIHPSPRSNYSFPAWVPVGDAVFHKRRITHTSLVSHDEAPFWFVPVSLILKEDIEKYLTTLRKDLNLTYR